MARTAEKEQHRGIVWLIAGVLFLALMFGAWALVANTNTEGDHDAELLPFFALIPLGIGAFHLIWSRVLGRRSASDKATVTR
jgi:hypothetical protein